MINSLFFLASLSTFSGDTVGADLYLERLKRFGASVLENNEEGLSQAVEAFEVVLDVFKGKNEKASRRLAQLRQTLASQKGDAPGALRPILEFADEVLNARDADASKVTSLSNDVFKQWEEAIQERKVKNILQSLNQLQVIASGSVDMKFLLTDEVES
jgi:hypothetical protein